MRMMLVTAAFLMVSNAAFAQEQVAPEQQPRCWLGSTSYSPGATVRAGEGVMLCTPSFVWETSKAAASGCVFEQKFFNTGAIHEGNECQPDGTWATISKPDQK
ncbi:MAG: hypothetical protein EOS36_03915 [Mesorhizobium sp.]|uniref:hypothetical protein n=1 Tax=Mesorhizobium sp. TaxID=1871066 RepID=UPI000FE978A4|nr:hypothetical protein [Mesorhizobium sp.]RWD66873.1 MAG: hypothetical protein EOS36_03915 [Mesorhizobium sp.]RWE40106.1 MAG: hypothetical protein EOS79_19640 [Mesorhizobium sp.]